MKPKYTLIDGSFDWTDGQKDGERSEKREKSRQKRRFF